MKKGWSVITRVCGMEVGVPHERGMHTHQLHDEDDEVGDDGDRTNTSKVPRD